MAAVAAVGFLTAGVGNRLGAQVLARGRGCAASRPAAGVPTCSACCARCWPPRAPAEPRRGRAPTGSPELADGARRPCTGSPPGVAWSWWSPTSSTGCPTTPASAPPWERDPAPAGRPAPGARRRGDRPARAGAAGRRPDHPGRPGDRPAARGVDRRPRGCASGTRRPPPPSATRSARRCAGPGRPTCALRTDRDWSADIVRHVHAQRRLAAAPGRRGPGRCRVTWQSPARLWLLLGVLALVVGYLVMQRRRSRYAVRFTNLRLLDRVAPQRPAWRRHVPAGPVPGHAGAAGGRLRPAHRRGAGAPGTGHGDGRGGRLHLDARHRRGPGPADRGEGGRPAVRRRAARRVQRRAGRVRRQRGGAGAAGHRPGGAARGDRAAGRGDHRGPGHRDRRGDQHLARRGQGPGRQAAKDPPPARIILLSDGANTSGHGPDGGRRARRSRRRCRCTPSRSAPRPASSTGAAGRSRCRSTGRPCEAVAEETGGGSTRRAPATSCARSTRTSAPRSATAPSGRTSPPGSSASGWCSRMGAAAGSMRWFSRLP